MIRLEDIVLIGPGSEWFWVMAQFLALAGTGAAILRQLRVERSATLYEHMTQWDHEFQGPEMTRAKLALLLAIQGRSVDEGIPRDADEIPDFFERIGYLVSRGHVDPDDFWNDGAWQVVEFYWNLLEAHIGHDRSSSGNTDLYQWFEWLEREMRRLDRRHGHSRARLDREAMNAEIAARIRIFRDKLHRDSGEWEGLVDPGAVTPSSGRRRR